MDDLITLVALDYTVDELIANDVLEPLPAEPCALCGLFVCTRDPPAKMPAPTKITAFESSSVAMPEMQVDWFIWEHEVDLPERLNAAQWIAEVHFLPCGHYMHAACALGCAVDGLAFDQSAPDEAHMVPTCPKECLRCGEKVCEAVCTYRFGTVCRNAKDATSPYPRDG